MNIGKEVAAMRCMTVADLRGKYAEVCGEQTRCRHKDYLVRRIAWRLHMVIERRDGHDERQAGRAGGPLPGWERGRPTRASEFRPAPR